MRHRKMSIGCHSNRGQNTSWQSELKQRCEMTNRQLLTEMLAELPDERLDELLDFAKYLAWKDDRASWQQFGQSQFAKVYGEDEPEYTEDDLLGSN
jgi:hypothetical protein